MTAFGYHQVMREVAISELKARLSENLRRVKQGETVTVLDRKVPVALISPFRSGGEPLDVRQPAGKAKSLRDVPLPPPLTTADDIVDLLLEDRRSR